MMLKRVGILFLFVAVALVQGQCAEAMFATRSLPGGLKLAASDAVAVVLVAQQRMIVRACGKEVEMEIIKDRGHCKLTIAAQNKRLQLALDYIGEAK